MIEGCGAAWAFFGGVFPVVVPDNLVPVVDRADPLEPRFNRAFVEYAQARGFWIDPARVRHPRDKPRVERNVAYLRSWFFTGEQFIDLPHPQRCAPDPVRHDRGPAGARYDRAAPGGAFRPGRGTPAAGSAGAAL